MSNHSRGPALPRPLHGGPKVNHIANDCAHQYSGGGDDFEVNSAFSPIRPLAHVGDLPTPVETTGKISGVMLSFISE